MSRYAFSTDGRIRCNDGNAVSPRASLPFCVGASFPPFWFPLHLPESWFAIYRTLVINLARVSRSGRVRFVNPLVAFRIHNMRLVFLSG